MDFTLREPVLNIRPGTRGIRINWGAFDEIEGMTILKSLFCGWCGNKVQSLVYQEPVGQTGPAFKRGQDGKLFDFSTEFRHS